MKKQLYLSTQAIEDIRITSKNFFYSTFVTKRVLATKINLRDTSEMIWKIQSAPDKHNCMHANQELFH